MNLNQLRLATLVSLLQLVAYQLVGYAQGDDRSPSTPPNILWITVEDMSPTLGCYGDSFAHTPNLDAFAKECVIYDNAFAASPVCSPSRSTLITGMYNASIGTHQMRSSNDLPSGVSGFPSFLRKAGYYTTNNSKTDYNCAQNERLIQESWNECSPAAHWKGRDPGQPFFAIFNDMTTHQSRSMVWPHRVFQQQIQSRLSKDQIADPAKVPLPPYYPDTPTVRQTMARYYDCVTLMDQNVGKLLDELKREGLADKTIVFFYSDHGSGLPRHKRLLLDSGMRVPLMIRFPKKFQHLAPAGPGTRLDRLVSFVDFPATVLNLIGQPIPEYMQGVPFLGPNSQLEREIIYGTRDRVDEAFEMARSARNKRYLYIRNYMPHLSYNQPTAYSDLGSIRKEINRIARETPGSLSNAQRSYAGPRKPAEEFYDCETDPDNLVNLLERELDAPQHDALVRLRKAYENMRRKISDVGVLPESIMRDAVRNEQAPIRDIVLGKSDHTPNLSAAWAVADQIGSLNREALVKSLGSTNAPERYWSLVAMRVGFENDRELHDIVANHLDDVSNDVRIEAGSWLAIASQPHRQRALACLSNATRLKDWWTVLRVCRAIELAGTSAESLVPRMKEIYAEHRNREGDEHLFLAFSSGAFLERLGEPTKPWDFSPKTAEPPSDSDQVGNKQSAEDGFVLLFDGESLDQWDFRAGAWKADNGAIVCTGEQPKRNWIIWRGDTPSDFRLRLDFKYMAGNSGVQVRSDDLGDHQVFGYQVEIAPREKMGLWHHSLLDKNHPSRKTRFFMATAGQEVTIDANGQKTTNRVAPAQEILSHFREQEWNQLEIVANGNTLTQRINGVVFSRVTDRDKGMSRRKGVIAFQDHGKGCKVAFRNIRIKNLPSADL